MRIEYGLYPEVAYGYRVADNNRKVAFNAALAQLKEAGTAAAGFRELKWLADQNAMDAVHYAALNNLGTLYEGEWVPLWHRIPEVKSPALAVDSYLAAAEAGAPGALANLGRLYLYGDCGVQKSWIEAQRYFIRALAAVEKSRRDYETLKRKIEFVLKDYSQFETAKKIGKGVLTAVSIVSGLFTAGKVVDRLNRPKDKV